MLSKAICVILLVGLAAADLSRFERLVHQSAKDGIVDMNGEDFQLHAAGKHNYSILVLFSTKDRNTQCPQCRPANDQFQTLANYYKNEVIGAHLRHPGTGYESSTFLENPVFFFYCDLLNCREFVIKAQWREIPKIFYIPPSQVKKNEIEMRELEGVVQDHSAERISKFLAQNVGNDRLIIPEPLFQRALPYVAGILGIYALVMKVIPTLMVQYKQPIFWYIVCLAGYAFAMAGTVFNSINKPPYSYTHPQNGQQYFIYPSARQQFVAEGLIMAVLLTLCASLFTSLGIYVPTFKGAWNKRGVFCMLLLAYYFVYDWIFKIFKMKYGYYPFWNN